MSGTPIGDGVLADLPRLVSDAYRARHGHDQLERDTLPVWAIVLLAVVSLTCCVAAVLWGVR